MTLGRVHVGRDVRVVARDDEFVFMEGACRLRPGHTVVIVHAPGDEPAAPVRTALVWNWELVSVGSAGPLYEGMCRWS